jgi:RNA polymerase-binding transcription factor DksA
LSYFNELKNEDLKQKDQTIKNLQQENESLKVELVKEKYLSENKSKELLEKNDDIQLLNKRIRSSRPPSSYVHRHENVIYQFCILTVPYKNNTLPLFVDRY